MTVVNMSKESECNDRVNGYPVGSIFEIENDLHILAMVRTGPTLSVTLIGLKNGNRWSGGLHYTRHNLTRSEVDFLADGADWHLVESVDITYKLA